MAFHFSRAASISRRMTLACNLCSVTHRSLFTTSIFFQDGKYHIVDFLLSQDSSGDKFDSVALISIVPRNPLLSKICSVTSLVWEVKRC